MQIDLSQIITVEDKARAAAEARAKEIKMECQRRILDELDEYTLSNIQGAAIAGELSASEMEIFKTGRSWVASMQAACRAAIASGEDPDWPDLPDGVADLAAQY